jgi:hypothetical protein
MTVYTAIIELSRASWRVLRNHPRLIWFPILGLLTIMVALAFLGPIVLPTDDDIPWLALLVITFVTQLIHVFFNVGLTSEALKALRGGSPTITDGIGIATERVPAIVTFAAITAPIGFVLGLIGRCRWPAVRFARAMVGTAWSLATYFAIPVMVQERRSGVMCLRRSGQLFQRTWGETTLSEVGLRVITAQLSIVLILLALLLIDVLGESFFTLLVVIALVAGFIGVIGALEAIYRAALYVFASEGVVPEAFGGPELDAIWRAKSGQSSSEPTPEPTGEPPTEPPTEPPAEPPTEPPSAT